MEGCSRGRGQFINSMKLFSLLNKRRSVLVSKKCPQTKRCRYQQFEVMLVYPEVEGVKDMWMACSQCLLHEGVFCFVFEYERLVHVCKSRGRGQQRGRGLRFRKELIHVAQCVWGRVISWALTGGWNRCRIDGPWLEARKEKRMELDVDNSLGLSVEKMRPTFGEDFKLLMSCNVYLF